MSAGDGEDPRPAGPSRMAPAAGALLVAALLLVLWSPWGGPLVMPGPLGAGHASLSRNCAACHAGDGGETKGLLHGISQSATALAESGRCQRCHGLGGEPLLPHGMAATELERRTAALFGEGKRDEGALLLSLARQLTGAPPKGAGGALACATCHREHGGADRPIVAMSDTQCQSCHAVTFAGFSGGHPELAGYPYARRSPIVFDHGLHEAKHHPEGEEPFRCTDCHASDAAGRAMLSGTFEATCAKCHSAELLGEGRAERGLPLIRLFGLDTRSLRAAGIDVGPWPADVDRGYDAPPAPFVGALLSGDDRYPELSRDRQLLDVMDLADLLDAGPAELAAAGRYARATKRLFYELALSGRETLTDRLTRLAGGGLLEDSVATLAGLLSTDAVRDAQERWLPRLFAEMAPDYGLDPVHYLDPWRGKNRWEAGGAWVRDDMDFSLRYLPAGHADPFLTAWHELSAAGARKGPALDALYAYLRRGDGRCTKCHSLEEGPGGIIAINWRAARRASATRLTEFSHRPHLPLTQGGEGCRTCHQMAGKADYLESYGRTLEPADFTSDFVPMERRQCQSCHAAGKASETCATCHRYHTGEITLARPEG